MKRASVVVSVLLAFVSASAFAQADPNVEIMKKLFTKLGAAVGVGSNDTDDTFLVLANPGTLIDPGLDMSKPADQYQLSRVLDKVMSPSWIYHPTNKSTLPLYKMVLDFHESPAKKVSAAQQALLDKARADVHRVDDYKAYRAAKKTLAKALDDCNSYLRTNPGHVLTNALAEQLDEARVDYNIANTLPTGGTFAADEQTIATYGFLDPAVWWNELSSSFLLNVGSYNGQPYATYNLYPSYPQWTDATKQWTTIHLSQSDFEQTTSSSHTSVGGGFTGGWGLWSVGADYSHQENRTYFKLDASGYDLVFEVTRVELDRPWMNDYVFQSRAWRWLNSAPLGSADKNISDGADAAHGQTPTGFMPFVPTALLLARNVVLTGGWQSDLRTTFDQQTSTGGSVGWGPFSVSGRKTTSDASTYTKANTAGNTISFGSPQIIGYFVEVLPASPNQDPSLNWPALDAKANAAADAFKMKADATDPLLKRATELLKAKSDQK